MDEVFREYSVSIIKQNCAKSPIRVDTPSPTPFSDEFDCTRGPLEMYKCDGCNFTTHLKVVFKKHFNVVHQSKPYADPNSLQFNLTDILSDYSCVNCGFRTSSQFIMMKHRMVGCDRVTRQVFIECVKCTYRTIRKRNLTKHMKTEHLRVDCIKCKRCNFTGPNEVLLQEHLQKNHKKWFKCELCSFVTRWKNVMKRHQQRQHKGVNMSPDDVRLALAALRNNKFICDLRYIDKKN